MAQEDFWRFWAGETVSQVGSQVSLLAVPLTAVLTLHASTFQVGVLTAVPGAAFLIAGLPAGSWVDRTRRRPVMIATNLVRAALLGCVPLAAALDVLSVGLLAVMVFAVGVCTVFFDVAYQSFLPALVGRDRLVEANGRLEASRSVAYFAGPSMAGFLVQALTAPVALLVDAATFVWSSAWLCSVRTKESKNGGSSAIAEGLRLVLGHPVLRGLAFYSATNVLFISMEHALDVVFLVRAVRLPAGSIGLLYGISSVGAVLGAFAATRVVRWLGQARTLLATGVLGNGAMLLIPLTGRGWWLTWYVLGVGLSSCCIVTFNVVAVALRQTLCPDRLLGRMNATVRFIAWGTIPLGALLGGALGSAIGLRPTLWLAGLGSVTSIAWLRGAIAGVRR